MDDIAFSGMIVFTENEVLKVMTDFDMADSFALVKKWYDGYNIGNNKMLCPCSVLNYLMDADASEDKHSFFPKNYWGNSSGNDIIEISLRHPDAGDSEKIQNLVDGKTEVISLNEFTSYPEITTDLDFNTFATLMLHTGYLTYDRDAVPADKDMIAIKIPNMEIKDCFRQKAKAIFSKMNPEWLRQANRLRDALFTGDTETSQEIICNMLMTFISFRDTCYESYYHGFMTAVLGLSANNGTEFKSNAESGNGYSDIILERKQDGTAVILEFKKSEDSKHTALIKACTEAIEQINMNTYDFHLRQDCYTKIFKYGIVFWGKRCLVKKDESPES